MPGDARRPDGFGKTKARVCVDCPPPAVTRAGEEYAARANGTGILPPLRVWKDCRCLWAGFRRTAEGLCILCDPMHRTLCVNFILLFSFRLCCVKSGGVRRFLRVLTDHTGRTLRSEGRMGAEAPRPVGGGKTLRHPEARLNRRYLWNSLNSIPSRCSAMRVL